MAEGLDDAIASLEQFLRKYPSGYFSEVAQARLDRLLAEKGERRVVPAPSSGNPFTTGSILASTAYSVGDTYEYRRLDGYTALEKERVITRVTAVNAVEVVYDDGKSITDLLGNPTLRSDGARFVEAQHYPAEYAVGKKWRTRYLITLRNGVKDEITVNYLIAAREEIVVPAGRFKAFRLQGEGSGFNLPRRQFAAWVAPDRLRKPIAREFAFWERNSVHGPVRERTELVAFSEAIPPG